MSTSIKQVQQVRDMNTGAVELVCPACRGALEAFNCRKCATTYREIAGVPVLLPRSGDYAREAAAISARYDNIYQDHSHVWEDQGREAPFRAYFSGLCAALGTGTLLEIGSGEGLLLEALKATHKHAIDISPNALANARKRTGAVCVAAIGEHLPFPDQSFDVVASVGVMEHFIDADRACREILRVLKPGGSYVMLIHVEMNTQQRFMQKVREYVFPRPHPLKFARWIKKKLVKRIHQPIRNIYTVESGRASLERNQLRVQRVITLQTDRSAPLAGHHVVIYVAERAVN